MKKLIISMLMLLPIASHAGSTYSGKILKLHKGLGLPNVVFMILASDPSNKISCSSHADYDYTFDVSTDDGKALMSMALIAYTAGRTVGLGGEGVCSSYSGTEDLRYLRLQ